MGIQSAGFPNLFTINAGGAGNFTRGAEPLVEWVSDCIGYVREHQFTPNPPKDTDGRREDSGRGWVRELQGRWPGVLG